MKISYKLYSLLIIIILAAGGGFTLYYGHNEYSSNENRYLENLPAVSFKTVINGEFQKDFINALNDQFIGRDDFMALSTDIKKLLGYRDINGVYMSDDNYYIAKITPDDISQEKYMQNLRYVQYFSSEQKGKTDVLFVPSAETVLSNKLPKYVDCYDADAMYKAAGTVLASSDVIDIRKSLNSSDEQVFYKTDHHWTMEGAYKGYLEFCKVSGTASHEYNDFKPKLVSDNFYGTLYSKVLDREARPDKIYCVNNDYINNLHIKKDGKEAVGLYDKDKLEEKDKYAYFFGGNYGCIDIDTGYKDKPKLLVIKDSFANSFVPFLLDNYSEITMIDLRYYDGSVMELAKTENYDNILVLYEMSNFAEDKNIYKLIK